MHTRTDKEKVVSIWTLRIFGVVCLGLSLATAIVAVQRHDYITLLIAAMMAAMPVLAWQKKDALVNNRDLLRQLQRLANETLQRDDEICKVTSEDVEFTAKKIGEDGYVILVGRRASDPFSRAPESQLATLYYFQKGSTIGLRYSEAIRTGDSVDLSLTSLAHGLQPLSRHELTALVGDIRRWLAAD